MATCVVTTSEVCPLDETNKFWYIEDWRLTDDIIKADEYLVGAGSKSYQSGAYRSFMNKPNRDGFWSSRNLVNCFMC